MTACHGCISLLPGRVSPDCQIADFSFSVVHLFNAFSALTLLVGRQEGHPACKKLNGGVWMWLSVCS